MTTTDRTTVADDPAFLVHLGHVAPLWLNVEAIDRDELASLWADVREIDRRARDLLAPVLALVRLHKSVERRMGGVAGFLAGGGDGAELQDAGASVFAAIVRMVDYEAGTRAAELLSSLLAVGGLDQYEHDADALALLERFRQGADGAELLALVDELPAGGRGSA